MARSANSKKLKSTPAGADQIHGDVLADMACTNTALRRASRRLGYLYDEGLAPLGLKATQLGLLTQIDRLSQPGSGQGPALQDLAAELAIQVSALTHALRPLVRDGLVRVIYDEQDRRTKRGVLTPVGKQTLTQALVHWDGVNRRVERILGVGAETLRTLADRIASEDFLSAYKEDSSG